MELLFQDLSPEEEAEYRQWARDHYTRLEPIKGIWHPAVQAECARMNSELILKGENSCITDQSL